MRTILVTCLLLGTIAGLCFGLESVDLDYQNYDYDTPDMTPGKIPEPQFAMEPNDFEEISIQIRTIMKYIKNKEQRFQVSSNENTTFVLGMPGSGKSTFINFLTQDNSNLIATKSVSGGFYIKNKNNRFSPVNDIYPELSDDSNGNNFVELPSFKQNSYYPDDFAAGYFNKKTIEATKHPKFIFTMPYSPNMFADRNSDTLNLISHTASLLRSILRFTKSMAIVVTKVPRTIRINNQILTDQQFKERLVNYLISVEAKVNTTSFYRNTIWKSKKIIEYLTQQNYKNIRLFKVPVVEGPISEDTGLQTEKQDLLQLVHNHLKFATINPNCIKYVAFTNYSTIHSKDFGRDRNLYFSRYFSTFMEAGEFVKSMFSFFQIGL